MILRTSLKMSAEARIDIDSHSQNADGYWPSDIDNHSQNVDAVDPTPQAYRPRRKLCPFYR